MLVVKFPGNRFSGEIIPALAELVENGTVRIVDLLFAVKNKQGDVKVLEFGDLDPDIFGQWDPLVSDVTPMLNEDDAREPPRRWRTTRRRSCSSRTPGRRASSTRSATPAAK